MIQKTELKTELVYLEHELLLVCENANEDIRDELKRIILAGGKRLRPTLAYVTYSLGDDPKYPILPLMTMIELMHTASLIHDDVVDSGSTRRGVITINKSRGNRTAVQAADFLLAKAMEYLPIYKGTGINERLASVSEKMCTGELLQFEMINGLIPENAESYMEIVKCKTSRFISVAAECGAIAAGLDLKTIKALATYGENIGIAFQLKDDLLDVSGSKNYLKQIGQDKERGIKTAPEIFGIEQTEKLIREYSNKAIETIENINNSEVRNMLIKMAERLCDRDR